LNAEHKIDSGVALLDEELFTPREVAGALKVSEDYVRRVFEREAGVIFLPSPGKASRRRYRTMRIPKSVVDRVCSQSQRGCMMPSLTARKGV
jgi:hypothetical protein